MTMKKSAVVTCAITGGGDTVGKHPAIPVTPTQIAASSIEAAKAGAAIVHIHVRDPATGGPSMALDLYAETVARIRESGTDVIINLTTGAGGRFVPGDTEPGQGGPGTMFETPERRVEHIERLRPEICSLDVGTMNFGERAFINTPPHLRRMATLIKATGARPELEVFEPGHIRLANQLIAEGLIEQPPIFQLCLGIPWMSPATPETMAYMRTLLPEGAAWSAFGISAMQMPMVAQAALLGGNVRVGLEDNLYIERGVLAPSNAALVAKAVNILALLGLAAETPAQARKTLGLSAPR